MARTLSTTPGTVLNTVFTTVFTRPLIQPKYQRGIDLTQTQPKCSEDHVVATVDAGLSTFLSLSVYKVCSALGATGGTLVVRMHLGRRVRRGCTSPARRDALTKWSNVLYGRKEFVVDAIFLMKNNQTLLFLHRPG